MRPMKNPYEPPVVDFLTKEELDRIEANMSYGSSGPVYGTSGNPYILNPGESKSVTRSECWFQCAVAGAVHFLVSAGISGSTFAIYEKKFLIGNILLDTIIGGNELNKIVAADGANTYLVRVLSATQTSISCCISQNVDTLATNLDNGALWKRTGGSVAYFPGGMQMYYDFIWYLSSDNVSILVEYISHDQYLTYQEKLLDGLLFAIDVATFIFPPSKVAKAAGLIALLTTGVSLAISPISFKQFFIAQIETAANYDPSNYPNPFSNGVKCALHETTDPLNGLAQSYDVEPWFGSTMTGPTGEVGVWHLND